MIRNADVTREQRAKRDQADRVARIGLEVRLEQRFKDLAYSAAEAAVARTMAEGLTQPRFRYDPDTRTFTVQLCVQEDFIRRCYGDPAEVLARHLAGRLSNEFWRIKAGKGDAT